MRLCDIDNWENIELFDDDAEIHDWGREAVYYMAGKNIIKGIGNNLFNGVGNAKIEEAILIALRSAHGDVH